MNQDMIHFIMRRMGGCLDNRQLMIPSDLLFYVLANQRFAVFFMPK